MRRTLVAANWKMNGSKAETNALLDGLLTGIGECTTQVVVCPPALYLSQAQAKLAGSAILLGAQNLYYQEKGAFTGEISAPMLTDTGCSHVIVGHSERRELFAEDNETVASKFIAAIKHDLTPILCVGETLQQRESGEIQQVITAQLEAVIGHAGIQAFSKAIIAYEPVWAIGTGLTASPEQAQEVHGLIRQVLAAHDAEIADRIQLLYGGSVKADNAAELFAEQDIDGALVGGASLVAEDFISICHSADQKQ